MPAVSQETLMPRVPGIRELVRDQAPREHRLEDSLRPFLEPQARHTKENEFLQHHTTKKAIIHVGFAEGTKFVILISFVNNIPLQSV